MCIILRISYLPEITSAVLTLSFAWFTAWWTLSYARIMTLMTTNQSSPTRGLAIDVKFTLFTFSTGTTTCMFTLQYSLAWCTAFNFSYLLVTHRCLRRENEFILHY